MSILIADSQPLFRYGAIQVLDSYLDNKEYLVADNTEDALRILETEKVDIAIIDLNLRDTGGLELICRYKEREFVGCPVKFVLIVSTISLYEFTRAKELDIDAYILRNSTAEDIKYVFNVIKRGDKYCPFNIIDDRDLTNYLTQRELEVLMELSKGLTNSEISHNLYISESTTKKHISNILNKLQLSNRMEAMAYANGHYSKNKYYLRFNGISGVNNGKEA
jgi:DNA-binding NarL/FixJ family response regulator